MSSNLPIQLTRFIGREQEIGYVRQQLAQTRLLTLTGPGGCGKTRLAAAVAAQVLDAYQDGVVWVDLASVTDASLVAQTVAKALGVVEQTGRSMSAVLADFLVERHLLLLLDNCEHLIAACARLVSGLLSACPDLQVLATSREPLALAGEHVYPVPALSVPSANLLTENAMTPDVLEALSRYEAVTLFLDRARAIVPGFILTAENARAVADICIRLDGMPLALELAAARANVLTAGQIAARLGDRFTFLKSDRRDAIGGRLQTLQAAIDWSYDLLTPPEQMLFRRLSVFAGGCSLATAEAVCTGDGIEGEQLLALLSSLVNKSLVAAETLRAGEARYTMLETIRQYAEEKLEGPGEKPAIRDRHLHCFLELVEETEPKLQGEFQQLWLNWLEGEVGNIRAALSWALQNGRIEAGLRIATALYQFWTIRAYREEGLRWFERLLAQAGDDISPVVRLNALSFASLLASFHGHTALQREYADEAVTLGETAGREDKQALVTALGAQAFAARKAGDAATAFSLARRAIELVRELDDPYQLGLTLTIYSFLAMSLGEYDQAHAMLDEGLPLLRAAGSPYRIAMALNFKGDLARCEQDYATAVAAYDESIALLRDVEADRDLASALHNQGHACLHLGEVGRARALFNESMAIQQKQQNTMGMAECLLGFAALAISDQVPRAGARLLAAAEAIGGSQVTSEWAATRLAYEHYLQRARATLGEATFLEEQAVGEGLSLEAAVAFALETAAKGAAATAARSKLDELTPRQREVAILVAKAKSNDEIAQQLVVSKRTVETHVSHILSKLGFGSRAQIVRWAIESGLVESSE
ncbi:MAG: LuxR C-terminal-related transcriptional regulator [Anaerolineae bacterium]|nr:LuxR C-terminal-related transcriptional regulator [Anaerolineae bacterium]